jgi:hypothetical protein
MHGTPAQTPILHCSSSALYLPVISDPVYIPTGNWRPIGEADSILNRIKK